MGTIAEKLTYLNTTKEKIRDSINLTGANLTSEDTFRSYASKLKKGYIDIINNGIDTLYNNFPKVSGIGSNLSLTPTYEAPMKLNEIQGSTLQNGTPTPDTPVEIQSVTGRQEINVCGKNLLNLGTKSFTTYYQESNIYIPAGTYTMSAKITSEDTQYPESRAYFYNGNTQVAMFTLNRNTRTSATKTLSNSADRIIIYSSIDYSSSNGKNATWEDIQLEQGSTATTYEPYKGNTYEVNLGKNLCNNALFVASSGATINSYTDNSISVTFVGTYKAATQFIDISNSIYTFSIGNISNDKGRMEVYLYNNGEQVGTKQNVTANQTYTIDNTSGLGDQIRLTLSNSDLTQTNEITFNNIQLEKGTQSTSFSPYFTPIELNKIGDYKDRIYKDNGKWYVEKNIKKLDMSTITSWGKNTNGNFYRTNFVNAYGIRVGEILSNIFTYSSSSWEGYGKFGITSAGVLWMETGDTTLNNVDNVPNWLSNKNAVMYGILTTPTYTEITNTELIEDLETLYTAKSQEETTNISITSEDLEMILNVSALKSE